MTWMPAGAMLAAGATQAHAAAPDLIHTYRVMGVTCVPGPQNTVRAKVVVRMVVVAGDSATAGDWARHMRLRARLIPTSAGINITRPWTTSVTPYLTRNRRHVYTATVVTDNASGTAARNAQA